MPMNLRGGTAVALMEREDPDMDFVLDVRVVEAGVTYGRSFASGTRGVLGDWPDTGPTSCRSSDHSPKSRPDPLSATESCRLPRPADYSGANSWKNGGKVPSTPRPMRTKAMVSALRVS